MGLDEGVMGAVTGLGQDDQARIEAMAIGLYEHSRDPDYGEAEYDWPNIDTGYDKDDEDETDPEWLRNRYRSDARAALAAAGVPALVAENARLAKHSQRNRGELSGYTVAEVEYVESRLRAAEAQLAEAKALLAATKFHSYEPHDMGRAYHADGVDDLLEDLAALLLGIRPSRAEHEHAWTEYGACYECDSYDRSQDKVLGRMPWRPSAGVAEPSQLHLRCACGYPDWRERHGDAPLGDLPEGANEREGMCRDVYCDLPLHHAGLHENRRGGISSAWPSRPAAGLGDPKEGTQP